jgi:hypothetical protein
MIRNELIMAQNRLSDTIARISQIELNNIKDATIANKKKKENEVAQQRSSMKQQKGGLFFFFYLVKISLKQLNI